MATNTERADQIVHVRSDRLRTLIERGVPTDLPDLLLERAPC